MIKKILFITLVICLLSINITMAQTPSENIMYKTYDGRWIIEDELQKGTVNYPYLIEDTGNNWKYTSDEKSIFIPKTFDIIETPIKISPRLTYSKTALANNMINYNDTVSYIVFPYSLSDVKTWSNENNIKFGSWLFQAGMEHISIYDESDNYLNPEYYEFKIINDEIRLYFVKSESNSLSGNITFEMHSWILDGHISFANSGDYYIDSDTVNGNFWIKDDLIAGVENIYIAEKTGEYTPNGSAVFKYFDNFTGSSLSDSKWTTVGSGVSVHDGYLDVDSPANYNPTIYGSTSIETGYIMEIRHKNDDDYISTFGFSDVSTNVAANTNGNGQVMLIYGLTADFLRCSNVLSGTATSSSDISRTNPNDWHTYEIVRNAESTEYFTDGISQFSSSGNYFTGSLPVMIQGFAVAGSSFLIDWVLVRKYAETEPNVTVIDKTTYYEIHVNSTVELTDYQIAIPCSELDITLSNESWNIYQFVELAPQNLTATPFLDYALIEWDNISAASYYNVYRIEPSILFTNDTIILDGVLDNSYSDIGQRGLLKTPNPEYVDQYDTIYAIINETYIFMFANAHDDDTSSIDDSMEIYFDFEQDGLTTDDKGYIIKENEQIIEQEWTGSQWISGGITDADGIVLGAGTNNTDYELFIPLSELPELTYGQAVDLVVKHKHTSVATTESYFPQTAFSEENVTGWQNMFIENSSTAADVFLFNTTYNAFNLTGLSPISWYRVGVSAVYNGDESNITYVEFITLQYPEYYIDGYVIDVNTSLGIENSIVTVTDTFTSGFEITDINGYYKFEGLRNDYYTMEASAVGYTTESVSTTVNNTNVTADNIYLEFISYTLEEIYNKIEETNDNLETKISNLETIINNLKMFILLGAMLTIGALYNEKRRN